MHISSRLLRSVTAVVLTIFLQSAGVSAFSTTISPPDNDRISVVRNQVFTYVPPVGIMHQIEVAAEPQYGELRAHDQGFAFIPHNDVCGVEDRFSYTVRRGSELHQVNVRVEILCEELTILSGFDPVSGDLNVFTIKGVENFPENELNIFDSWGELVFAAENYHNDWDGTHPETGESLADADSMYYYVFDDGRGQLYSGYLKIGNHP